MKLAELLEQMHLKTLYRHVAIQELPEETCVLMGEGTEAAEDHILILPAEQLESALRRGKAPGLSIFCGGQPEEIPALPTNCNVVCFSASPTEIAVAAQRAIYALRRKAEPFFGRESLLDRLLEGRIQGNENAAEILQGLGLRHNHRFCLVLVSFFGRVEEIPWEDVSRQLSRLLNHCVVSEYRGDLLALCPVESEERAPQYSTQQLEHFLSKQSAYAVVSNSAMRPAAIRALYRQARSVMRFGIALSKEESTRIFFYEKYAFYHIVELCANVYNSDHQIQNLVYLCHPALGRVLRYDRSHGTNYTEILRKYLENNCNLSQTAREMFMHRNTMLNKLEVIREVLGVPLTNPEVREQLQFSFHVVDYAEKIQQGRTF